VTPWIGLLPWSRFETLLEAKIIEADPAQADRRAEIRDAERFVRTGRDTRDGLKTLVARADAGDVIWFMAMTNRIAEILQIEGDSNTADVRRSKAIGILGQPVKALDLLVRHQHDPDADGQTEPDQTQDPDEPESSHSEPESPGRFDKLSEHHSDQPGEHRGDHPTSPEPDPTFPEPVEGQNEQPSEPGSPGRFDELSEHHSGGLGERVLRAARPPLTLYLHLSQEAVAAGTGVARMEGVGPVTLSQLRRFLIGTGCQITIRPVIDLNGQPAPADSYEIPNRLREHLHHRNPASVFPYSPNTSRRRDLDHSIPYLPPDRGGPPGQTSVGNLGPLTRSQHRHKTFGRWRLRQPQPGVYLWRSPHGRMYLVNDQGTFDLGNTGFAKAIWRAASEVGHPGQYTPAA
jgi:hypothetical protein